jgi:hypothetical protein
LIEDITLKTGLYSLQPGFSGIVENPEDYLYSSARNYCSLPGQINVILADPMVQLYSLLPVSGGMCRLCAFGIRFSRDWKGGPPVRQP